jgi:predicted HTH domain antitoxin
MGRRDACARGGSNIGKNIMLERNFQIQVSQSILQFGFSQVEIQRQINEWLVLSLFTSERISSGKAAQLLNISRIEFLALLRKRGIAFIDYTTEELEDEFVAMQSLKINSTQ